MSVHNPKQNYDRTTNAKTNSAFGNPWFKHSVPRVIRGVKDCHLLSLWVTAKN